VVFQPGGAGPALDLALAQERGQNLAWRLGATDRFININVFLLTTYCYGLNRFLPHKKKGTDTRQSPLPNQDINLY
jgi:hypothetical protein